DDVDAHCDAARRAGAEIVEEPADQPFGDRIYLARDPEGHEWYFAQHLRDVAIDELTDLLARAGG
ncbi:MAG TPA: VOC family protein, partial [Acidimicrobiales bacterium]